MGRRDGDVNSVDRRLRGHCGSPEEVFGQGLSRCGSREDRCTLNGGEATAGRGVVATTDLLENSIRNEQLKPIATGPPFLRDLLVGCKNQIAARHRGQVANDRRF